jgi:hypothetical protein
MAWCEYRTRFSLSPVSFCCLAHARIGSESTWSRERATSGAMEFLVDVKLRLKSIPYRGLASL